MEFMRYFHDVHKMNAVSVRPHVSSWIESTLKVVQRISFRPEFVPLSPTLSEVEIEVPFIFIWTDRRTKILNTASRPALGPIQPPMQRVPGALSLGVKRPWREADHSPPSNAEVKNAWSYTSTPPTQLHCVVLSYSTGHRDNFTFYLLPLNNINLNEIHDHYLELIMHVLRQQHWGQITGFRVQNRRYKRLGYVCMVPTDVSTRCYDHYTNYLITTERYSAPHTQRTAATGYPDFYILWLKTIESVRHLKKSALEVSFTDILCSI
jgi:hypothetical protein